MATFLARKFFFKFFFQLFKKKFQIFFFKFCFINFFLILLKMYDISVRVLRIVWNGEKYKYLVALTLDLGLSASAASSCCIFTLTVRQPPVLASCIEI